MAKIDPPLYNESAKEENAGEAAKTVAVPAFFDVRSGRDSNPRAAHRKLISSF